MNNWLCEIDHAHEEQNRFLFPITETFVKTVLHLFIFLSMWLSPQPLISIKYQMYMAKKVHWNCMCITKSVIESFHTLSLSLIPPSVSLCLVFFWYSVRKSVTMFIIQWLLGWTVCESVGRLSVSLITICIYISTLCNCIISLCRAVCARLVCSYSPYNRDKSSSSSSS